MFPRALLLPAIGAALLLTACNGGSPSAEAEGSLPTTIADESPASASSVIVLGDIADDPAKKIARFTPLAEYLAANLTELGISEGQVKIAPDVETMAEWLESGAVDLYFDSLYPAMIVSDRSGAVPILRRWKDGVAEYHTVLFARADSGIAVPADFKGELLALDEQFSTSGFLLPVAYLVEQGLQPVQTGGLTPAGPTDVRYEFAGDDDNVLQWVISGRAAIGAIDGEGFNEVPEATRQELVIIAETIDVPRQLALARPDIDAALMTAINELLIGLDESPEGEEILAVFKTTQFGELPGGADEAFVVLRNLYELATSQ